MNKPLTLLASLLLCTSCTQASGTSPAKDYTAAAGPSAPVSLSAGSGPQAPGDNPPTTTGISWDEDSKKSAAETAVAAMADFARPRAEASEWSNDFARWLTPQATADYSTVDPANIPASRVTGPAALTVQEDNGYVVTATVPTDAGPYRIQLLRTAKDSPWKVHRLTPPAS